MVDLIVRPAELSDLALELLDLGELLARASRPAAAVDLSLPHPLAVRTACRRQLKQQLRDRRSLADALPVDQRHLPGPSAPTTADTATGLEADPATVPPLAPAPAATHRLRIYAAD